MERITKLDNLYNGDIFWNIPIVRSKKNNNKILVLGGNKYNFAPSSTIMNAVTTLGNDHLIFAHPKSIAGYLSRLFTGNNLLILPETPSGSISGQAESQIIEESQFDEIIVISSDLSANKETQDLKLRLINELDKNVVIVGDTIKKPSPQIKANLPTRVFVGAQHSLRPVDYQILFRQGGEICYQKKDETLILVLPSIKVKYSYEIIGGIIAALGSLGTGKFEESIDTSLWIYIKVSEQLLSKGETHVGTENFIKELKKFMLSKETEIHDKYVA